MKIFLLVVRRSFAFLQRRFEQKSVCLDNLRYSLCRQDGGRSGELIYLYSHHADGDETAHRKLEFLIASVVAQFIVYDLRELLLRDLLRYNYFYFRREEREEILALARKSLGSGLNCHRQETYREIIERKVREYWREQNEPIGHLNIEGFLQFRLQDYQQELKRIVDDAVERFLTEKEYREFVRLLKYFLELQQPKIDLVHLAVDEKGQFQITDQHFQKIDPRDWEEFDLEDYEGDNDYEDVLVSMLVSVAPRQIMLHQNVLPRYPRAVETLRRIFDRRLLFCQNCPYCRPEAASLVTKD